MEGGPAVRLYGKRFMTNRADARIGDRKESRDAVVYDISETGRYCRVQVAGSSVLVRAWFPANFMRAPNWLKTGIAVRIAHVGGSKSRIEVTGPGLVQPTANRPPMQGGVDAILTGMSIVTSGDWTVTISAGTYRINGVGYIFNPGGVLLGDDVPLGGDLLLGEGSAYSIDPMENNDPADLWFRYDAFVVGTDGVIDYLKGEEWEWVRGGSGPTKPDIPTGHVLVRNYILLWSGTTAVEQGNIGREWEAPRADHLDVSYAYHAPTYEEGPGWARAQEGVGVILGGDDVYAPASPGGLNRGSGQADMQAGATISVMTQYNTQHTYLEEGVINYLEFRSLGSESYGGYGELTVQGEVLAGPTGETGSGPLFSINLGLGYQTVIAYLRKHSTIAQPDIGADGYPSYKQGDADSHTATYQVSAITDDLVHPVTAILTFWNLDGSGNPQ